MDLGFCLAHGLLSALLCTFNLAGFFFTMPIGNLSDFRLWSDGFGDLSVLQSAGADRRAGCGVTETQ